MSVKKVFFLFSIKYPEYRKDQMMIVENIRKLGYEVAPNFCVQFLDKKKIFGTPKGTHELDINEYNQSDYFIAEMTGRSFTIGYFYAQALAQKKPILILIRKDQYNKDFLSGAVRGVDSDQVLVEYYTKDKIHSILKRFFNQSSKKSLSKFNFIINPYIADYLEWVAHVRKQPKSDYLRKLVVSNILEKDNDYLDYLKDLEREAWKPQSN